MNKTTLPTQHPAHRRAGRGRLRATAAVLCLLLAAGAPWRTATVHASTTITVTTTSDVIGPDFQCSLREAIIAANTDTAYNGCPAGSGADTIVLQNGQTYTLSKDDDGGGHATETGTPVSSNDDLDITSAITIQGNGATIQRSTTATCNLNGTADPGEFRIFEVHSGATLTLQNITVRNGCADGSGGDGNGGAIAVSGTLTMQSSTVSQSRARGVGGGIDATGSVTLTGSTVTQNQAYGEGGGIKSAGPLVISNSTIANNVANADNNGFDAGGGVHHSFSGTVTITDSTISGNSASTGSGGGIFNASGTATLTNSTISGNSAIVGSGIVNDMGATLNASFVTVANNTGGPGVRNLWFQSGSGTINIKNSIVADNPAGNCANDSGATFNSQGGNFASDNSCPGFTQSSSLNLQPLANNGGPTQTHALGAGSAAIDAAADCNLSNPPGGTASTDQRGVARPQGSQCDAGAFERAVSATFTVTTTADTVDANPGNGNCADTSNACSLRAAIMEANALGGNPHTIVLQNGQTYTLSLDGDGGGHASDSGANNDDLDITSAITIQGNGATIQRSTTATCNLNGTADPGEFRIFEVHSGAALTLQNVTVRDGCADESSSPNDVGGGIFNNSGTLTITNSTISGNSAAAGGGIANAFLGATLTITNSTISGNSAGNGSGIVNGFGATLNASFITVANNTGGSGLLNVFSAFFGSGTINIKNSIVADNPAGNCANDPGATFNSQGGNFASDGSCTGFTQKTSAQLKLGPLANNGGPTQTHALGAGSAAIDAAADCNLSNPPGGTASTDQRGVARPQGSQCDAGAFEAGYVLYLPLIARAP